MQSVKNRLEVQRFKSALVGESGRLVTNLCMLVLVIDQVEL